jgi:acetylornithine deacetylase/succinyl-diaminopimelate desuccinylase-like protein
VIPPLATAEIQLSLVPDQHPDDLTDALRQWVEKQVADEFEAFLEVYDTISQPPYVTPRDHPALAMLAEAMTTAWQCEPAWMRNAGGGPSALLADALGAPVVLFGTGLPEDSWHGPDESAHIDTLLRGAMTAALWWQGIAASVSRPRSAQQRRA